MIPTRAALIPVGPGADFPVTISVLCATCVHLGPGLACAAYPGGIPTAILDGELDHREPLPGDGGIRYELAPNVVPPSLPDTGGGSS